MKFTCMTFAQLVGVTELFSHRTFSFARMVIVFPQLCIGRSQ